MIAKVFTTDKDSVENLQITSKFRKSNFNAKMLMRSQTIQIKHKVK